jgi:Sulfotransferase domain
MPKNGPSKYKRRYKRNVRKIKEAVGNKTASIHKAPVFVMGNQKAGTTAIAALLAAATNKSITHDFMHRQDKEDVESLFFGRTSVEEFINKNRYHFSTDIIKDNSLTFFYEDFKTIFSKARFFLIIRDPRENIRSILNRLKIPGDLKNLEDEHEKYIEKKLIWRLLIEGKWPEVKGDTHIEKMAHRWNLIADIHTNDPDNVVLIRYEDFVKNKKDEISSLADKVGFETVNDISDKVNVQFQPGGQKNKSLLDIFGKANLERIESICEAPMKKYGYLK